MTQSRDLAARAVSSDLLGPDVLRAAAAPPAPEGYELVREIGRGGGGEVWLAHETTLDRAVALKYLSDARAADVERFRREARFTARLASPSIVQVYGLGEVDGRFYIAMQYVGSGNLATADLDMNGVLRAVREVAAALCHAHRAGIVHRDIKPENILVDAEGRAYLTDFGIARDLHGSIGATISQHGAILGTPGLMPPEQARGATQDVDARSDVYALGATLYRRLTGRYPFEGDNVVDVLHAVLHAAPAMPRSINAQIPRALEAIVLRCLAKPRGERYQSMEEVLADLDRHLAGQRTRSESSAWFRRLVAKLVGAPEPEPSPPDDTGSDPYSAEGMEIVREISAWDADLYRVTGSLARSFARLDGLLERLDALLAERPDLAWARFYRGVVLFRRGRLREALEEMECAIDRVSDLAGAYFELGRLYLALFLREQRRARKHIATEGVADDMKSIRGRLDQAVTAFAEAQRLAGELPEWHAGYAKAVTHFAEGDLQACVAACDATLATEADAEDLWKLRADALHVAGGDPFPSYDRALTIRRSDYEGLYGMAEAHLARGQTGPARAALQRAFEIHPEFSEAMALYASTYLEEGRASRDVAILERGAAIARRALEMPHGTYDAAVVLAELELERGRYGDDGEALAAATAALDRARDLVGCQNRVNLLRATVDLERACQLKRRGEDAGPLLVDVVERCDEVRPFMQGRTPWDDLREAAEAELERRG